MKSILFFLFFLSSFCFSQSQDAWVYFIDKPSQSTYLDAPITMLTQRAIDRRVNQSISLDIKDVPLEASYVAIISETAGISVLARSKWLNALHIRGEKSDIDALYDLSCVNDIQYANTAFNKSNSKRKVDTFKFQREFVSANYKYGTTENQVTMLHGDVLHNLGYTGLGFQIAILDSGFKGVDSFAAFSHLTDGNLLNGEVLGGYDFVNRNANFYADIQSTHGLSVLSTISGYIDEQFVGAAPNSKFYLFSTEDALSETPLEESLWVEAAERADSLGVDIINTSLGYTVFDNAAYNYSYEDMDGQTTFISRGAKIACTRGMLLVTSAGNEGISSWKYISAPADVDQVLTVGAVDENETIAYFSSFGPAADGRVKPDVVAQGKNVYVINSQGHISISNGTSFSGPIMTGMAACLWQAFPNKTAQEIKSLILESSNLYESPSVQYGYGLPNFKSIIETSLGIIVDDDFEDSDKRPFGSISYPNPARDKIYIDIENDEFTASVRVLNMLGAVVIENKNYLSKTPIHISFLDAGVYLVEINFGNTIQVLKIIKE